MSSTDSSHRDLERISRRALVFVPLFPLLLYLFLFLPAGDCGWVRGWILIGVFFGVVAIMLGILSVVNPSVLAARSRFHEGRKHWDTILVRYLRLAFLAILVVAALDDGRFHWYPLPWWVTLLGYFLFLIGAGLMTWAEAVNRFFEPHVRIQTDRDHKVIDTGPYAFVRHPGYLGFLLMGVGIALGLGSAWSLIPGSLAGALIILRTSWEDQTLQAELAGYSEYAKRVHYRLLPGVW